MYINYYYRILYPSGIHRFEIHRIKSFKCLKRHDVFGLDFYKFTFHTVIFGRTRVKGTYYVHILLKVLSNEGIVFSKVLRIVSVPRFKEKSVSVLRE